MPKPTAASSNIASRKTTGSKVPSKKALLSIGKKPKHALNRKKRTTDYEDDQGRPIIERHVNKSAIRNAAMAVGVQRLGKNSYEAIHKWYARKMKQIVERMVVYLEHSAKRQTIFKNDASRAIEKVSGKKVYGYN
jgi:histone H3/H4